MSSLTLSILLFALYIYFPALFFKLGVSQNNEIKQNSPDQHKSHIFYFCISIIISSLLAWISSLFYDLKFELAIVALSSYSTGDLKEAFKEFSFLGSGIFLIINYMFNFIIGLSFNSYNAILRPPSDHLLSWQRALNLKDEERNMKIHVDVMTKNKIIYSGSLSNIQYNKDDQIELLTLLNPSRRSIGSDCVPSAPSFFRSFRFLINYSDVSNINLVEVELSAVSVKVEDFSIDEADFKKMLEEEPTPENENSVGEAPDLIP